MSPITKLRIRLASAKYDTWLDFRGVKRKRRRALTSELRANLVDASCEVGVGRALAGVGSTRKLASEVTADDRTEPNWALGFTLGIGVFVAVMLWLWVLSLYYVEGVIDSGTTNTVSTSLFPFWGSNVTVEAADGLAIEVEPGPLPFVLAAMAFIGLAKPWRLAPRRSRRQFSAL